MKWPGIKEGLKDLVRSNAHIEMMSYLLQNNLLHRWVNFSGDGDFGVEPEAIEQRCRSIAKKFFSLYQGNLEGKIILEIGTGRSMLTAYLMSRLSSALKVYTYDAFEQVYYEIDKALIKKHFHDIKNVVYVHGEDGLSGVREKVDYVFSNAVLEHVWDLEALLHNLNRLSHRNTITFHRIDLRNHNKFSCRGPLYFHKFSDTLWELMACRVGHPNRLLVDEYEYLFRKYGFSFEIVDYDMFDDREIQCALDTYLKGKFSAEDFQRLKYSGILALCSVL